MLWLERLIDSINFAMACVLLSGTRHFIPKNFSYKLVRSCEVALLVNCGDELSDFFCLIRFDRLSCHIGESSCAVSNFHCRCKCFRFTPVTCKIRSPDVVFSFVFLFVFFQLY